MTKGRVLVTGCSSGIGRALAREFHRRGYQVFPTARKPRDIEALSEEGFTPLSLDITDEKSIRQAIHQVTEQAGGIDMLVNNAGHSLFGALAEIPLTEVERLMQTNFHAQLAMCQAVIPVMAGQGAGTIVNVGSIVGHVTTPFVGAYSASKAALHILSESLRMEVSPLGIDVVVVQPGAVRSSVADTGSGYSGLEQYDAEDSLYYKVRDQIRKRAMASQDKPTEADDFARGLLDRLEKNPPPRVIRLGRGAGFMNVLSLLPAVVRETVFSKHFKLDRLG
jgi:short-subunit dehydrogenase